MDMNTAAKFLFVMDPYETLNLETETSLLLMQELIERGQSVYWLQQEDLSLVHDQPMGLVFPVTGADPLQRAEPAWSNLAGLMRCWKESGGKSESPSQTITLLHSLNAVALRSR